MTCENLNSARPYHNQNWKILVAEGYFHLTDFRFLMRNCAVYGDEANRFLDQLKARR